MRRKEQERRAVTDERLREKPKTKENTFYHQQLGAVTSPKKQQVTASP